MKTYRQCADTLNAITRIAALTSNPIYDRRSKTGIRSYETIPEGALLYFPEGAADGIVYLGQNDPTFVVGPKFANDLHADELLMPLFADFEGPRDFDELAWCIKPFADAEPSRVIGHLAMVVVADALRRGRVDKGGIATLLTALAYDDITVTDDNEPSLDAIQGGMIQTEPQAAPDPEPAAEDQNDEGNRPGWNVRDNVDDDND